MNIEYKKSKKQAFHIISGASLLSMAQVFHHAKYEIDKKHGIKLLFSLVIVILNTPLMLLEGLLLSNRIRKTKVEKPVFILGYPRSGTTYLMYLMSKDPQFAYCKMYHCMGPHVFYLFGGMLRRIAAKTLPSKRPMDNLELGPDVPKEEEFAFANMGAESMANAIYFPRRFSEYFDKYVLFKGHPKHKKRFLSNMDRFFRKLTTLNGGKQLLLKSPFNTGRIDAILELYPDARFIHIHRDPLEVFCSNEKLYESVLPEVAFHHVENHEMENHVLYTYKQTMDSFLRSRNNLSPRQLFDLSYSDFVSNPVYWLEKAYAQLELSGFETARGFFESEAQRYENYKRNNPVVDDKRKNTVDQHWSATYRMIKND